MAVSNSDIFRDVLSVSATELLTDRVLVAVTDTWVTLKEDDVNVEPVAFSRVADAPICDNPMEEMFTNSDDGNGITPVV